MVRHPGTPFWAVVIGSGSAYFGSKLIFPMNPFRAIWNIKSIWNAQSLMFTNLFPSELIRPNIESSPPLGIGDKSRHGHWPFYHSWKFFTNFYILIVPWFRASDFFVGIVLKNFIQFFLSIFFFKCFIRVPVFSTFFASCVSLCSKTPTVTFCNEGTRLVKKIDVIDLLDSSACKLRLMFN